MFVSLNQLTSNYKTPKPPRLTSFIIPSSNGYKSHAAPDMYMTTTAPRGPDTSPCDGRVPWRAVWSSTQQVVTEIWDRRRNLHHPALSEPQTYGDRYLAFPSCPTCWYLSSLFFRHLSHFHRWCRHQPCKWKPIQATIIKKNSLNKDVSLK